MPVYDFKCGCGWRGDIRCAFGAQGSQRCPECGKPLVVVIHAIASMWGKGGAPISRNHR